MPATQQRDLPVYDHREGAGPTLVFLHYWGGSAHTWDPVIERLPGRETLAVDFRGWGRSRHLPAPFTLEQFADDVRGVIAESGIRDYVLVGHSMGGKVAQLIAATGPVALRGVVLVASAPARPADEVTAEYREALSHAYDSDESVAGARDNILTARTLSTAIASQVVADSRSGADAARTEWPLRGIARDITENARAIRVPVLVIAGEHDRVEPVDVLRTNLVPYLSDAAFQTIPGTGHLIPLEAPVELSAAIAAFAPAV